MTSELERQAVEVKSSNIPTGPRDEAGGRSALQRGLACASSGDAAGAIDAWEEAVRLDPENSEALFRLAYALDQRGEDERAIELYEQLVAMPRVHVNALLNLAVLYEDCGEYEHAISCCRQVLASHPNHARARLFLKDADSSLNMYYDETQERVIEKHSAILDTPVSDFELSVRARNCLKQMNIETLGDLLQISEQELLGYKNFGETSLNEIKAMLKFKGLHLGQTADKRTAPPPDILQNMVPQVAPEVLAKPVSELELSVRSRKCLQRLNIMTLGDLAARTEAELLGTKNFGQTSLNEVKQRLEENNMSLRRLEE